MLHNGLVAALHVFVCVSVCVNVCMLVFIVYYMATCGILFDHITIRILKSPSQRATKESVLFVFVEKDIYSIRCQCV